MSELSQVLRHLIPVEDPRALVDASTGDDAGVYLLADDRALVVTLDFFSPVVDDPRDFGRIAAANALSDVYAMGASPLLAMNLFAFPREHLGEGVAEAIIAGGSEIAREAGVPILGGHSIDDPEPKYGMVVIGEAHPDRLVTNAAGRPGTVTSGVAASGSRSSPELSSTPQPSSPNSSGTTNNASNHPRPGDRR